MVFDPSLEQKQCGNHDQQQSHGGLDEVVDASAMDLAQVHQKTHSEVRAGNAADRQRQYHFHAYRALAKVHEAGGNLGEEVAQCIAADSHDGGDVQAEDQHGQQQNSAPPPVIPISVPTVKPISTFSSKNSMPSFEEFSVPGSQISVKQNHVKELRKLKTGAGNRFQRILSHKVHGNSRLCWTSLEEFRSSRFPVP